MGILGLDMFGSVMVVILVLVVIIGGGLGWVLSRSRKKQ